MGYQINKKFKFLEDKQKIVLNKLAPTIVANKKEKYGGNLKVEGKKSKRKIMMIYSYYEIKIMF